MDGLFAKKKLTLIIVGVFALTAREIEKGGLESGIPLILFLSVIVSAISAFSGAYLGVKIKQKMAMKSK